MKAASGKANAKLILLGEHFVVPWEDSSGTRHPGSSALAIPLPSLNTEVHLTPSETPAFEFNDQPTPEMEKAIRSAAASFRWDLDAKPLRVSSWANFPLSRGLGSSAAFSVALIRAFRVLAGDESVDLFEAAQKIENIFHGQSSGLDTSVILKDRPIVFRDGRVQETFEPIAVDWVVVDSGPRDECSALVQQTLKARKAEPSKWHALGEKVNQLARRCASALEAPQGARDVAAAIRESGEILAEIGLVTPNVARVLELGKTCGALAGKVSGAGAGGAVLFVAARGEGPALARRLREAGATLLVGTAEAGANQEARRSSSMLNQIQEKMLLEVEQYLTRFLIRASRRRLPLDCGDDPLPAFDRRKTPPRDPPLRCLLRPRQITHRCGPARLRDRDDP